MRLKLLVYTRGGANRDTNPLEYGTLAQMVEHRSASADGNGSSPLSPSLYRFTITKMIESFDKNVCVLTTEEIRNYLSEYQTRNDACKATIDNIRHEMMRAKQRSITSDVTCRLSLSGWKMRIISLRAQ